MFLGGGGGILGSLFLRGGVKCAKFIGGGAFLEEKFDKILGGPLILDQKMSFFRGGGGMKNH